MFPKHERFLVGAAVMALLLPGIARADKIILPSGQTRQGIVTNDPNNPNLIIFRDHTGTLRLPRDKVKQIIQEEPFKGYLAMGNAYLQTGDGAKAMECFKEAEANGAAKADVQEAFGKARLLMEEKAGQQKARTLGEIEELVIRAQEAQEAQNFTDAEKALDKAAALNPTKEQIAMLRNRRIALHLAWGKERQDRVDYGGAAKHFAIIRELDPQNEIAMKYLIENIRKDPAQWKEVGKYYESELKRNPENLAMRRDAADLFYEHGDFTAALPHYIVVFDAGKAGAYAVEAKVERTFQNVVRRLEGEKNYAAALETQKQYQARFPQTDPKVGLNLEYALKRDRINATTGGTTSTARMDKLAELALWCHSAGLEDKAEKELAYVLNIQPAHVLANQLLGQYARQGLDRAQARFAAKDYVESRKQARQTIDKYPSQREIVELAAELIEKCTTEIDRVMETKRGDAMEWARKGDQDWATAQVHIDKIRDSLVNQGKTQINDYNLAVQYIDRAIDAWRKARGIDPSLASPTQMNLNEKIRDAEDRKASLRERDYARRSIRPGSGTGPRQPTYVPPVYYDFPTSGPIYGPVPPGTYPPVPVVPTNPWYRRWW